MEPLSLAPLVYLHLVFFLYLAAREWGWWPVGTAIPAPLALPLPFFFIERWGWDLHLEHLHHLEHRTRPQNVVFSGHLEFSIIKNVGSSNLVSTKHNFRVGLINSKLDVPHKSSTVLCTWTLPCISGGFNVWDGALDRGALFDVTNPYSNPSQPAYRSCWYRSYLETVKHPFESHFMEQRNSLRWPSFFLETKSHPLQNQCWKKDTHYLCLWVVPPSYAIASTKRSWSSKVSIWSL